MWFRLNPCKGVLSSLFILLKAMYNFVSFVYVLHLLMRFLT